MSHPVTLEDFRARRFVLDPEDFAWGSNEPDPEPSDRINKEIWDGIIHLPDDVAIRTSNEYGAVLELMYNSWGSWFEAMGEKQDPIWRAMLDAADEFQATTFNALHGFYRPAIGGLRNIVELMTVGLDFQIRQDTATDEFAKWRAGASEMRFGNACDKLIAAVPLQPLKRFLKEKLDDGIFEQKTRERPAGWARRLHDTLSNYGHSRPTYAMGDLWQSNGPVFVPEAFKRTVTLFFEVLWYSYILIKAARPNFELPDNVQMVLVNEHIKPTQIAYLCYEFLYLSSEGKTKPEG